EPRVLHDSVAARSQQHLREPVLPTGWFDPRVPHRRLQPRQDRGRRRAPLGGQVVSCRWVMKPERISDPADPRLADYRDLRARQLLATGGKLVAESEVVVKTLLASGFTVHSVLVTAPRLETLAPALAARPEVAVWLASQEVVDAIAGFHVHRG